MIRFFLSLSFGCLFLNCLFYNAHAASINTILENNKAIKALAQKNKSEAYDILSQNLVDHPEESALSYNLGYLFESNEEKEKAIQSYTFAARQAQDPDLKFKALFNLGNVLVDMKKRDEALVVYQEALELNPDSQEVKTNIELLFSGGQGGGKGENQQDNKKDQQGDNKDKQDQKNDSEKKDDKKNQPDPKNSQDRQNPKPSPKPFKSDNLSQRDVGRILDELKRQEEGVRAKFNEKNHREAPVEKDW